MVGVHHRSGIFMQMEGGTPPQWNIYPQGGAHLSGIFIPRGGYTTSVEHLCTRGGYTTSVEYLSRAGGCTTSLQYLSRGGGVHNRGICYSHFPAFSAFFFAFFGQVP